MSSVRYVTGVSLAMTCWIGACSSFTSADDSDTGPSPDGGADVSELADATGPLVDALVEDGPSLADAQDGAKRVFITSSLLHGDLGGVVGADNLCTQLAMHAGFSGPWKAFLGSASLPIVSRFGVERASAYFLLSGQPVFASGWDPTTASPATPILVDERGNMIGDADGAWIGDVTVTGADDSCGDWAVGDDTLVGAVGAPTSAGSAWRSSGDAMCDSSGHLYCFEAAN